MRNLGQRLRDRARAIGLSDAEVARRAGLSERRYGNYVTGAREPDLETLVRICGALAATPNDVLTQSGKTAQSSKRERLTGRLMSAVGALPDDKLELAICQTECLIRHGGKGRS
jgi:transcriptional regulator with XRE-family HTH domain